MPDVPVSLVPWFDAKDNPPKDDYGLKLTDQGDLFLGDDGKWCDYSELDGDVVADPQPEWWADHPSPPDMSDPLGPLTADDLRDVGDLAEAFLLRIKAGPKATDWEAIARLRRALAALPKEDDHE